MSARRRIGRWLAMLVLPASIVPVPLLGPALLRSPHRLYRQTSAAIERLARPGRAAPHGASRTAPHGPSRTAAPRASRTSDTVRGSKGR